MRRAAWWHCFSGVAGDMALGSLVDAGADLAEVEAGLRQLPLAGWSLQAQKVQRGGIVATHVQVEVDQRRASQEPRHWAMLRQLLAAAEGLPERAVQRAQDVFARLARAEAHVHGVAPEDVHFHEVGAIDAVVDIVGTCLALETLGIDVVTSSAVAVGQGTVRSAHGLLPNPAPAVLHLLKGAPVQGTGQDLELTTPTGAALLAALVESWGPAPAMRVSASGYGAGSADPADRPNVLQVVTGELGEVPAGDAGPSPVAAGAPQELVVVEANVDDVTGEVLAYTIAALVSAGALDAWAAPVTGKKGRPGHVLSALAAPGSAPGLAELMARQTGVLGWRTYSVERWALGRHQVVVEVEGQPVRVKVGPFRSKAEHDDCAVVAARSGLAVAEVARRAEQQAAEKAQTGGTSSLP